MSNPDIFAPYERLVEIKILDKKCDVPENNTLLRCFQFLAMDSVSQADLCWNGDCLNCQVWIKNGEKEKGVISCRTTVVEGMEIVRLSAEIELAGINT
ncbi:MAG: (2Fe-2S)-binding protein [Acidobacteria bacterium]|nr:(2Fe-2S)-binding protein [Acidobacteriota bacterium]HMU32532.1 2Fe-2S iron-sulfur cluster-binding protein [Pyrinomonadaceae bacterium]